MASRFSQPSSALSPVEVSTKASVTTLLETNSVRSDNSQITKTNSALSPMQRQYADILSCMAKHHLQAPVLGVAWDGSVGDGLWGGEFLQPTQDSTQYGFERVARFLPYYLPNGDYRTLEPRRSALSLLYSCYGETAFEMMDLAPLRFFTDSQLADFRELLTQERNVSTTSSVGQMFEGIASLLDLHHYVGFEGQAIRTLEFAATQSSTKGDYPFVVTDAQPALIDWRETIKAIVEDYREAVMTPVIAAKFHNTLVEIVVEIAHRTKNSKIVLAGSCFQNKVLIERAIRRLSVEGFTPYWI